jgi:hypothetical protein
VTVDFSDHWSWRAGRDASPKGASALRPARELARRIVSIEKEHAMSAPAYRAYSVIEREGKDDFWLNLGVAFAHEDGEGFNILLQALPIDAKLVLRTYKEQPEEQDKVVKGKFKK